MNAAVVRSCWTLDSICAVLLAIPSYLFCLLAGLACTTFISLPLTSRVYYNTVIIDICVLLCYLLSICLLGADVDEHGSHRRRTRRNLAALWREL
ncbi:hypothetical protein BDP27DRAFT_36792 [Rhodocollybia butyracea]|uniref:Uncharacterized protein n=1 Tax=Rhodocollybia butyracea TaxID=206335 RepID=A0A9P5PYZ6_9AGAR|nr:hypothetical protein BDP27DRAFT_36792 [Rhodocollybia butyracea]